MSGYKDYSTDSRLQALLSKVSDQDADLVLDIVEQSQNQEGTIQQLCSERSKLQSATQALQKKVQEQSARIVKLNNSDRQLKEAEMKLRESKQRERNALDAQEKAEISASSAEQARADAERKYAAAEKKRRAAEQRAAQLDAEVKRQAEALTENSRKELQDEYNTKKTAYKAATLIPTIYAIILTVLMATRSDVLGGAAWRFLCGVGAFFAAIGKGLITVLTWLNEVPYGIGQPIVSGILGFILPIGFLILLCWLGYLLIRRGIPSTWEKLRPYFDIYVLWIALLLLAVNVIFGDLIVDAGGNPVGLGILAFVLLFAGRCFLGPEPKDSRDSYSW